MKDKIKTESVRIEADILERARKAAKRKWMTIGGFITYELTKAVEKIEKRDERLSKND